MRMAAHWGYADNYLPTWWGFHLQARLGHLHCEIRENFCSHGLENAPGRGLPCHMGRPSPLYLCSWMVICIVEPSLVKVDGGRDSSICSWFFNLRSCHEQERTRFTLHSLDCGEEEEVHGFLFWGRGRKAAVLILQGALNFPLPFTSSHLNLSPCSLLLPGTADCIAALHHECHKDG